MLRPSFDAPDVDVSGVVLVRVPPGRGGRWGRLVRLARRTGSRFAAHKLGTLAVPRVAGALTGRPVFLDRLSRSRGVPVLDASSVNAAPARRFLEGQRPEVLLSVSCPERIEPAVLAIPSVAAVNIHWALLPAYAGIAPYFWVLRNGERETGITVHVMTEALDLGPVLRRREVTIRPGETSLGLQLRLAQLGGQEILGALRELPGSLDRGRPQDPGDRSYFSWPSRADVRTLARGGRRLARWGDYVALVRRILGPPVRR